MGVSSLERFDRARDGSTPSLRPGPFPGCPASTPVRTSRALSWVLLCALWSAPDPLLAAATHYKPGIPEFHEAVPLAPIMPVVTRLGKGETRVCDLKVTNGLDSFFVA